MFLNVLFCSAGFGLLGRATIFQYVSKSEHVFLWGGGNAYIIFCQVNGPCFVLLFGTGLGLSVSPGYFFQHIFGIERVINAPKVYETDQKIPLLVVLFVGSP